MSKFQWVILGSVGGGVTVMHIDSNQGMTYAAAQKLADEINTMYVIQATIDKEDCPCGGKHVPVDLICRKCRLRYLLQAALPLPLSVEDEQEG